MRNRKRLPPPPKTVTPQPPRGILELDRFDEATLEKWNERSRDIDQLENELFYSVLPERKRRRDEILGALASVPPLALTLENWSRIVSYQFSLQPLSCAGSMLTYGGRFNPGAELDPQTMAPFPALYLAEDYETAFREKFQLPVGGQISGLVPEELALDRGGSHTVVQVRGQGSQVFELTQARFRNCAKSPTTSARNAQWQCTREALRCWTRDFFVPARPTCQNRTG